MKCYKIVIITFLFSYLSLHMRNCLIFIRNNFVFPQKLNLNRSLELNWIFTLYRVDGRYFFESLAG